MNKARLVYFSAVILSIIWLISVYLQNEITTDTGDGIMHFFISQASWHDSELFLNHWGKPLFILLSSTFAQFGFAGMVVFNIAVFAAICLVALKIFEKLGVSLIFASLFPFVFLLPNDVTITVLGGLTEPLFNLCLVIGLYLLISKKWLAFALVLSFAPFLRSEGQLVLLVSAIVLLLNKQWKYVPLLGVGFLLYAIIGWLALSDFWWYFNKSAYSYGNNIYGKGTWGHYALSYDYYLGNFGLFFTALAVFGFVYLAFRKQWNRLRFSETFFAAAIFIGIVLIHSYLWANAKYGSLGLTRIATQGVASFLIMAFYFSYQWFIQTRRTKLVNTFFFAGLIFTAWSMWANPKWPLQADVLDKQVSMAGKYLGKHQEKFGSLYYQYPLLAFEMGLNPLVDKDKLRIFDRGTLDRAPQEMKRGDVFAWDSHFGPLEGGVEIAQLDKHPDFAKVQSFTYYSVINVECGVVLYQYKVAKKAPGLRKKPLKIKEKSAKITPQNEFMEITKIPGKNEYRFLDIVTQASQPGIFLVCTNDNNEHYQAYEMKQGKDLIHFSLTPNSNYNLYYWNQHKTSAEITLDSVYTKVYTYKGL
ncbi:MAG: hypothetical protein K0R65_1247 [Crocinitomicaceae bacterium]|jgi:hypothetical protein|nr:hypothetical protein [Crocinitomicaceae bacterium]